MKKLIMAVAIVCAAVGVQAASVDWDVTLDAPAPSGDVQEGWAVYLVNGANYATFAALDAVAQIAYVSDSGNVLQSTEAYENRGDIIADGTGAGSWDAGATASAFAVVVDNADITKATAIAYTTVGSDIIGQGGQDGYIAFGNMSESISPAGWQTVATPEPTSGLLLLIGMAGLSLRRRRA